MADYKKKIKKLEERSGAEKERLVIFIQQFVDNPPKCNECPKPKVTRLNEDYVVFPNNDCDCPEYKEILRSRKGNDIGNIIKKG